MKEKSTVIAPAEHFMMRHYSGIGYGYHPDRLNASLEYVGDLVEELHEKSEHGKKN